MAACKSAWLNELTNSSLVGVADGEGDGRIDLVGTSAPPTDGIAVGDCARAFVIRKMPINAGEIKCNIRRVDTDVITHFQITQRALRRTMGCNEDHG